MAKYIAKSYLLHKGSLVEPGGEVELSPEQAKRLGEKVGVADVPKERELKEHNMEELKGIAQEYEIEGYSSMKKDELIEAIEAHR